MRVPLLAIVGCGLMWSQAGRAHAECRAVGDLPAIEISSENLAALKRINYDRAAVFAALKATSLPETQGCWAAAEGNFDGQVISVGTLQWNYGQDSLQRNFALFRTKFRTDSEFKIALKQIMPINGDLVFSAGCTSRPISADCKSKLLKLQDGRGHLLPDFKREMDALFNSDPMIQIQVDRYLSLLTSVEGDVTRLFGNGKPSPLQVKWAVDTKVQQGGFPKDESIARVRKQINALKGAERAKAMHALVNWYQSMCELPDQDGTRLDYKYNVQVWHRAIDAGFTDEQFDLMHLTYVRSRSSTGQDGRWQALTFQRRTTIILGVGSVAGRRFPATPA